MHRSHAYTQVDLLTLAKAFAPLSVRALVRRLHVIEQKGPRDSVDSNGVMALQLRRARCRSSMTNLSVHIFQLRLGNSRVKLGAVKARGRMDPEQQARAQLLCALTYLTSERRPTQQVRAATAMVNSSSHRIVSSRLVSSRLCSSAKMSHCDSKDRTLTVGTSVTSSCPDKKQSH
ncbi:uncharacterized protein UDID_19380 [Ustilago sp. UG-2017a]|nr:uncharacterized protein UDID_19380 [Ustilago sp. UG-2017a]